MAKILMAGSRQASDTLRRKAIAGVWRCWYADHEILVGDAIGIDAVVVRTAEQIRTRYIAYGLAMRPRNGAKRYKSITRHIGQRTYSARDQYMVDQADIIYCLWNGKSKGTLAVYQYARMTGKVAYLVSKTGILAESQSTKLQ